MKYVSIILLLPFLLSCSDEPAALADPDLRYPTLSADDLKITLAADSTPADGAAFSNILFKAADNLLLHTKTLSLKISPIGKFSDNSTAITVSLDANGEARAFVSSAADGIAYLNITAGTLSRSQAIRFYKPLSDSLTVYVSGQNVAADNVSLAEIVAVTKNRKNPAQQIVFTTDKGVFANGEKTYTIQVSANDTTRAYLRHSVAGNVRVTATINSQYSKELHVQFAPSWPQQLFIDPSLASMPSLFSSKATIKARLVRAQGSVSHGQTVFFYDSTAAGGSAGVFLNTSFSGENGEASTEYWVQDTAYRGTVYIKGYVNTDQGRITGVSRIILVKQ